MVYEPERGGFRESRPEGEGRAYKNGASGRRPLTPNDEDALRRTGFASDELFVVLGLHDLAATIKTVRADVVTQMHLTRGRLDSGGRRGQKLVRAVHTPLRRCLFVLLNCHNVLLRKH